MYGSCYSLSPAEWQVLQPLKGLVNLARFGHGLHHLLHLAKLFDKLIDLTNRCAGPLGDSPSPASVQDSRIATLFRSHGVDDRFNRLVGVLIQLRFIKGTCRSGYHADPLGQIPTLLHL